uniref:Uncharacterized protein n=1 Tax=Meleagris gallopavo TaxID=9103 RepID=A0A803YF90_MELGA
MDGAWVGTWRPHRPRGLISAQSPAPGPSTPSRGQQVRRPSPGRDAHWGRHGAEQLPSLSSSCRSLPQTRLGSCTEALRGLSLRSACAPLAGVCTRGLTLVRCEAPHGSPPLVWEEEVTREGNVGGPGA